MGMAASQARFLGLTARKTNVEYQGQQVNQQRASLANESAGLYNQMVNLKLPMPPSAVNYYSSRYTFESAALDNSAFSITNFERNFESSDYKVTLQYKAMEKRGFISNKSTSNLTAESMTIGSDVYTRGSFTTVDNDLKAVIRLQNPNKKDSEIDFDAESQKFARFDAPDSATDKTSYYVLIDQIGQTAPPPTLYFAKDQMVTKTAEAFADLISSDSTTSSRFTSINLKRILPPEAAAALGIELENPVTGEIKAGYKTSYDLEVRKAQDDEGYDEATKEYEYQKMLYDRSIQDINARTEMIQQQDKNLELKLRQLDTEQKALQTEMEAVQKVIQKNVETTFKTFG